MLEVAGLDGGDLFLCDLLGRSSLSSCLRGGGSGLSRGSLSSSSGSRCLLNLGLGGSLSCDGLLGDLSGFLFLGHGK